MAAYTGSVGSAGIVSVGSGVNELPHAWTASTLGYGVRSAAGGVNELPHAWEPSGLTAQGVEAFPTAEDTFTAHQRLHSSPDHETEVLDTALGPATSVASITDEMDSYEGSRADGNDVGEHVNTWAYIPLKFFHEVTGRAVTPEGEPITDARFIATADNLGTVGSVDDEGYFSIYLLRVPYQTFFLGVPQGAGAFDLVWYRQAEGDRIGGKTDNVEITFVPESINTPLDTTTDLRFSGV